MNYRQRIVLSQGAGWLLFWRAWRTLFRSQRKWVLEVILRWDCSSEVSAAGHKMCMSLFLAPQSLWALSRCPELFPLSYSMSLLFTLGCGWGNWALDPIKSDTLSINIVWMCYPMFQILQPANVGVLSWVRMKISALWLKHSAYSVSRARGTSTALCCQWEGRLEHSAEVIWTGCPNNLEILHIWRPGNFTSRVILWKQLEICDIYEKPCPLKF